MPLLQTLALGARQAQPQLTDDFCRQLFLQHQDVGGGPLELPDPDVRAVGRIHELRPHDDSFADGLKATEQDRANAEVAAEVCGSTVSPL